MPLLHLFAEKCIYYIETEVGYEKRNDKTPDRRGGNEAPQGQNSRLFYYSRGHRGRDGRQHFAGKVGKHHDLCADAAADADPGVCGTPAEDRAAYGDGVRCHYFYVRREHFGRDTFLLRQNPDVGHDPSYAKRLYLRRRRLWADRYSQPSRTRKNAAFAGVCGAVFFLLFHDGRHGLGIF